MAASWPELAPGLTPVLQERIVAMILELEDVQGVKLNEKAMKAIKDHVFSAAIDTANAVLRDLKERIDG